MTNVVYLHTHDLGRYSGPHGYPPRMPNLQRLAEQGTLYRNAFCAAPTCTPSRATLLTGQYPHQCGMYGLTNQGWTLNAPARHLAAFLHRNGFETALMGCQHVTAPDPQESRAMGYSRIGTRPEHESHDGLEPTTDAAEAFLASSPGTPFFVDVGCGITHHSRWDRSFCMSHDRLGDLDWRYVRPLPHLPDTPETRWEAAMQFKAAEYLDTQIGRVLTKKRMTI
ncbi:MAG: sulfatase-like hydrolase/transferase [Lentisphaerae bacterium]|jgi:N-sulfoglucosamine sulfohydrolase|nr:sulfatase-like hydrolase/transferase [Lentisphaerota bacterium]MBT4820372.1 sulfatase-like hydrolase/transferase [Lentisphaerota bacterium]MBT5605281.1 sulfatase-like hydrolase/transferase [Lentisphaerota bacterium]MBT7057734.1 sulfatase-like hydrolase/transferase [Lentisphaerota bacterium]MBT7844615.1 sulfatase-like hydrolase/transferase [Lentisphaerota bacterium]